MPRFSSFSSNSSQQQGPSAQQSSLLPSPPDNGVAAGGGGPIVAPPPQRHDTLPLHTFAHQQNAGGPAPGPAPGPMGRGRDLCDGPSAPVEAPPVPRPNKFTEDVVLSSQEISSSQMFGGAGQGSPKCQKLEDQTGSTQAGVGQFPPASQVSPVDRSIGSWLGNLGCQQYLDIFTKKGVRTIDQLDEVNLEDFAGIAMPQHQREKLWKAILQLRHQPAFSTSSPSGGGGMVRTGSNASTASYGSMSGLSGLSASQMHRYQATRFTLKQTMSFKVKEEVKDEEDGES